MVIHVLNESSEAEHGASQHIQSTTVLGISNSSQHHHGSSNRDVDNANIYRCNLITSSAATAALQPIAQISHILIRQRDRKTEVQTEKGADKRQEELPKFEEAEKSQHPKTLNPKP